MSSKTMLEAQRSLQRRRAEQLRRLLDIQTSTLSESAAQRLRLSPGSLPQVKTATRRERDRIELDTAERLVSARRPSAAH